MDLDSDDELGANATEYLCALARVGLAVALFVAMAAVVFTRESTNGRARLESNASLVAHDQDNTSRIITGVTGDKAPSHSSISATPQNRTPPVVFYLVGSQAAADALKATMARSSDPTVVEVEVIDSPEARFTSGANTLELTLAGRDVSIIDER